MWEIIESIAAIFAISVLIIAFAIVIAIILVALGIPL